jgi:hypothetical protein
MIKIFYNSNKFKIKKMMIFKRLDFIERSLCFKNQEVIHKEICIQRVFNSFKINNYSNNSNKLN